MASLLALVLLAFQLPVFVFADLRSDLTALGITAYYPGDSSYASASKAFNQRFTFQPAAVAYPQNAAQVAQIVQTGAAQGLPVVARSGGHSYIANGLGGKDGVLVVDLSKMKGITINSAQGTATIETGNRLGNVAQTLANSGRALPHGTCPYVGIGGHSAYGGFGFTSRMWGLTLDTIQSINVVLANGTSVTASSTSNSDLFWGLRGAAPSFGITTSITVKTFAAPSSATIFEYTWDMTAANAAKAIASFQSFAATNIPKELGAEFTMYKSWRKGYVGLELVGGWYGAASQLNSTLAPLLNQLPSNPSVKQTPGTYINSVKYLGGGSLDTSGPDETDTFYAKSLMTPASSPMASQAASAFTNYMANQGFDTDLNWFVQVELYGGQNSAINAVAADATAFGRRTSMFAIQFYASSPSYQPPFPSNGFDFVDGLVDSITANAPSGWDYGAYANYIDDKLADWETRYYGSNYARLQTLKASYDPQDTFVFPQAIEE